MKSRYRFSLFSVGLLLIAPLVFAQTTGEIRGTSRDSNGGSLPGVSVEAKSPALQGTKTAVTGNDGGYRISLLPPGEYTVSFALAGFGRVEKKAAVQLDKTVVVDATLSLSQREEVVVSGQAPVIDATSSSTGANFTSDFIKTLPVGRGFQSVAIKTPGVVQGFGQDSNNFNVHGSTGAENSFVIDGVDTTEIQYGRQGKAAPGEFIQEIEVKAGGFQAEYGHAQGGVLNAITKSGGNDFHGDAFGYYNGRSNDATGGNIWQAADKHTQEKSDSLGTFIFGQTDPIRNTLTADWGADLGGFFIKDRIWFFGAYDRSHQGGKNFLNNPVGNGTIQGNAGPGTGTLTGETTARILNQDLYAGKLTFRILEGLSLVGSVFGDPSTLSPNLATPLSGADPGTYQGTQKQGGTDYTGRLSGVVGSHFLFELQGARHNEKTVQAPAAEDLRLFSTVIPSGVPATGGLGFHRSQTFYRNFFRGALSYYANFIGSHEFKAGGDYAQVASDSKRLYTGPVGNKEWVQIRNFKEGIIYQHEYNSSGLRNAAGDPIEVDVAPGGTLSRSNNTGAFFQDKWQILPTLTLNLGVRWEDQKVKDISNLTQIHINDEWMPRLGFAWDFVGGGRSRLYGNYSRFYETMPTDINIRAYGLEITTAVYNRDPNSDHGDPTVCGVFFTPIGGTTANTRVCRANPNAPLNGSASIKTGGSFGEPTQPGIKGQYSDGITFGVQYEPVQNLSLGIEANYRSLGRVIEDGASLNAAGDLEYFIFNPGTTFISPDTGKLVGAEYVDVAPRRFYRAIQLTAQKRFSNQLQFIASYVYSKLEGNYDGVFQTATTQLDPNINSAYDYRVFLDNARGYLSNDRRHTVKLDGSYVTPFRLTVGLSAFYYTGTPVTQRGFYNDYRNYELYLSQRGSVGRTPSIYDADLHLGYTIPMGPVDFNVGADIFNLLNEQRVLQLDERYDLTEGGSQQPNYLRPIRFTPRRSLRVFGKVSF